MMKHVVTIIQARTASSRLPRKVLMPLGEETVLEQIMARVQAAEFSGTIVIATTTDPADDMIAELCRKRGYDCYRGHPHDLLDRHYQAARAYHADAVVKIPSDCPLIDPRIIDKVILAYLYHSEEYDYVSNLHPATYPDGNDVEIMSMHALEAAWREAKKDYEREHTTPFIWDNPGRFRLHNVAWEAGKNYAMTHRWTLDYAEDYDFIKRVFAELHPIKPLFGLKEILDLLLRRPELQKLNEKHLGANWYHKHWHELKTVSPKHARILSAFRAK